MKERSQIDDQYKWQLEDMFPTAEAWEQSFADIKRDIPGLAARKGGVNSAQALLDVLELDAELSMRFEALFAFARMRRDEDNRQDGPQGMVDRATALAVELSGAQSYITPEILEKDDGTLLKWCELEGLRPFRHTVENILRGRGHVLSAGEERLLAMGGELAQAPRTIFAMLDNADLRFPSITVDGEEIELTTGVYTHIREHRDQPVRREAFEKFFDTYKKYENTYAATLAASVKKDAYYAAARNHGSAIERDLHADNVPLAVYDSLIAAVHGNLPALHRYLDIKRRALKLDALNMYDLYVPLTGLDYRTAYTEAVDMVTNACAPLGGRYQDILASAFSGGWIDVYENRSKTSGAYSWGAYGHHPYVLMNYKDDINSAFTLAHEMGHALHSYFSDASNDYTNAQYPIFIAEVASTVNEALLLRYLLERADDAQKIYLLLQHCEQFRTTLFRQVMFAEFERKLHALAQDGRPLTARSISGLYAELNGLYNRPAVQNKGIEMEWAYISHFYNAFYVYQYATGFSSALYLSKQVLCGNVEPYMELLASGGKDYPLALLQKAGVDLTTPLPVDEAMTVFSANLDRLETLLRLK